MPHAQSRGTSSVIKFAPNLLNKHNELVTHMAIQRTLDLLQSLMSGHTMTVSELDSLVNDAVPEDLFLDYKHGNELNKKEPSLTIRQYMSGFANSEGGILIVGVD